MKRIGISVALAAILTAVIIWTVGFSVISVSAESVKYLNGDANGDEDVNIVDVTVIQRLLVESIPDNDEMIRVRGDVDKNGLEIIDATHIQRYLASYGNPYQIGKTLIYTPSGSGDNTEPTRGDNELPEDIL